MCHNLPPKTPGYKKDVHLNHNFEEMKRRRTRPAFRRQRRFVNAPFVAPRRRKRTTGVYANPRIGGFLGIELKFYDSKLTAGTLNATSDGSGGEQDPSATVLFNTVVQGDGESNRDGRQIVMKSLSIRGTISVAAQTNQTVPEQSPVIFMALILDTQTNGATVASEDVYVNKAGNSTQAASPFRNLQNIKRFRVLKSKRFGMQMPRITWDGTNIEQAGYIKPFEMYVDLKNMGVNYSGTTETVANITDNSLHLVAWTSHTDNVPTMNYNARLRFVG